MPTAALKDTQRLPKATVVVSLKPRLDAGAKKRADAGAYALRLEAGTQARPVGSFNMKEWRMAKIVALAVGIGFVCGLCFAFVYVSISAEPNWFVVGLFSILFSGYALAGWSVIRAAIQQYEITSADESEAEDEMS